MLGYDIRTENDTRTALLCTGRHDSKSTALRIILRKFSEVDTLLTLSLCGTHLGSCCRDYYAPKRAFSFSGIPLVLQTVRLSSAPRIDRDGGCEPYFKIISSGGTKLYDSRAIAAGRFMQRKGIQRVR